tara:strand:- start:2159 stop:3154 length:996 start_codon:yes stop_codon:yes gene_type:complete
MSGNFIDKWEEFTQSPEEWNERIEKNKGADFRQSFFWGDYLKELGWNVKRLVNKNKKKTISQIQVNYRIFWPFCAIYINGISRKSIQSLPSIIRYFDRKFYFCLKYYRIDSHDEIDNSTTWELNKILFKKTTYSLRSRQHTYMNINESFSNILEKAKHKWRYNFKKAAQNNINFFVEKNININEIYKISSQLSKFKNIKNLYKISELKAYEKYLSKNVYIIRAEDNEHNSLGYYICILFNSKAYQIFNAVNSKGNKLMVGYTILSFLYESLKDNKIDTLYMGELNKERYPGNYQFKSGLNQNKINIIGEYDYSKISMIKKLFNLFLYIKKA